MAMLVNLTIDGVQVSVPAGTLIVNAAKQAGIDIPVFCYHPKMEPVGMCRMCLVEIGRPVVDRATGEVQREADGAVKISFGPKLETACTTPVAEGMVVLGASEKAKAGREDILEFLLTSHPLDCPICDKGGECPLQNLTMGFGPGESRYLYDEKMHLAKNLPLGELIYLDRERCIQCGRCVRFQDEIVDDPVIGFYNRGRSLEIVSFSEPGFDSYFSGNTTDICPVGALTTADFRFRARPWELNFAASLCTQCPVGCNTTLNTRREAVSGGKYVVKRVMPRQNEQVNEIWICDKGRFGYHYAQHAERLEQPLIRKNGVLTQASWDEALDLVSSRIRQVDQGLVTLAGGRLTNEDLFNLYQLTTPLQGKAILYTHMAGGDLTAQVGLGTGTNLGDLGRGSAILVVACDLEEEAPIWWLRVKQAADRGATVIVANPRQTKLDRSAKFSLRYPYGSEASVVLAMLNSLSAKRPDLPESARDLLRDEQLKAAAQAFSQAENGIVIFGSEGTSYESSQALAQACANLLLATDHVGKPNNGLLGVWPRANDQGAWDMGFRPEAELTAALQEARLLYIVAADPAGDDPGLAGAMQAEFTVVQDLFLTQTGMLADVVLPVQSYAERQGSFTSGERRVQLYYPAIPERPGSLPDYAVTARIGKRLDIQLEERSASRVMDQIAAGVPAYAGIN
ncbi:MAG TPA: NADH-quinone oxidoreductase subunit NuoG, partial [Anaerolineales bacterium]|nr:NADH-quinone oxidoreductase subunit NuoG [Anaerolineales bacterium]